MYEQTEWALTPEVEKEALLNSLDPGIRDIVFFMLEVGVETFESCQGGEGHSYFGPTVRFHGGLGAGMKALGLLMESQWRDRIRTLGQVWLFHDHQPHGPVWQVDFWPETVLKNK